MTHTVVDTLERWQGRPQRFPPQPLARRPRVSVVIPCYRYGRYLEGAVASALDQAGVDVDVLIVDDASPDDSAATARSIVERTPHVRLEAHHENRGHIATYNHGLSLVDGEYVVVLSADDLLAPDSLTRSVALLEAHQGVGFCYGHSPVFGAEPPAPRQRVRDWYVWPAQSWLMECARQGRNLVFTPEVVMRRSAFVESGGYRPDVPQGADMFLWMQTNIRHQVGRVNGCDQAFYRVHGGNMHLTTYQGAITDLLERRAVFARLLDQTRTELTEPHRVRRLVERALVREALVLAQRALDSAGSDTYREAGIAVANLYVDFAREVAVALQDERIWPQLVSALERARSGADPTLRQRVREHGRELGSKARWRRWRRHGW